MRIIADAFGGDNAPKAIIEGCAKAAEKFGVDITLVGNEDAIKNCANEYGINVSSMEIIHTDGVISMHDDPKDVLKKKADSSMSVGLRALAAGEGDAFLSAGSTGALVLGSTFLVKRIKGIKRVAFGSEIPTVTGNRFFLMDEGANADCRPEMLLQFGIMSSLYMQHVLGIEKPRVGLLNIGTEDTKGGETQLAAYKLLKDSQLNFIGNIEARELMNGVCDVAVADGFSGNICLKAMEGTAMAMMGMLKTAFTSSAKTKLAAAMVMPQLKKIKSLMNYKEIGCAPIIGVKKPVFKAHGNSDAEAFCNAIGKCSAFVNAGIPQKLEQALKNEGSDNDE